jgi:hypothetical protein
MNTNSALRTAAILTFSAISIYYMVFASMKHMLVFSASMFGSITAFGLYLRYEMNRIVNEQNERILQASKELPDIY